MHDKEFFKGQAVLVTGASGFIGSRLCICLHELGAKVHCVSRRSRKDGDGAEFRWWQADLEDEIATRRLVESVSPEIIFHLASLVTGKREIELVLSTLRSNLLSTVNLLVSATEIRQC